MEREADKGKQKGKRKAPLRVVEGGNVIPLAKGQGKDANGFTVKQEAFCQNMADLMTGADAYRKAYNADNMAPHTIHNEACKLLARPDIAARINTLIEQKRARSSHDAARIKASVIERLQIEANDSKNPASVRVRALELLGKMTDVSLFTDRVETKTVDDRTPDAIKEELKQRLAKLAG